MGRVAGKVALVIGAGPGGIGATTAEVLAREGAKVVVGDVDAAGGEEVVRGITSSGAEARFIQVDVRDEDSIKGCVTETTDAFGRLDILHNNVGGSTGPDVAITEADPEVWTAIMNLNLLSALLATKWAVPHMIASGGGSIINTTSIAGLSGNRQTPAYAAAKSALFMLTINTATWYGRQGIRCNAIVPGMIVTPQFHRGYGAEARKREELYLRHNLLPRLGQPIDAANAVLFLASEESSYITAQMLRLDGGLLAHMPYYAETLGGADSTWTPAPGASG